MKALLLALLLLGCIVPQVSAVKPVSIYGRMHTEVENAVGLRIKTVPITPSRLYKEYRLSRRDYVLATGQVLIGGLMFYPRKDTNLPTVVVLQNVDFSVRGAVQARFGQTQARSVFELPLTSPPPEGGVREYILRLSRNGLWARESRCKFG